MKNIGSDDKIFGSEDINIVIEKQRVYTSIELITG
jgi:hypothetical protein